MIRVNSYFLHLFLNNYLVYFRILLHFLSSLFYSLKNPILQTYPPKMMILNVDFALKLSNYTS